MHQSRVFVIVLQIVYWWSCRQQKRKIEALTEPEQLHPIPSCSTLIASAKYNVAAIIPQHMKLLYPSKATPDVDFCSAADHQLHPGVAAKQPKQSKQAHQFDDKSSEVQCALQSAAAAAPQHMQSKLSASSAQPVAGNLLCMLVHAGIVIINVTFPNLGCVSGLGTSPWCHPVVRMQLGMLSSYVCMHVCWPP